MAFVKKIFKRKVNLFYEHLLTQAQRTLDGLHHLEQYMLTNDKTYAEAVNRLEKEADEIRRVLIDDLNHTFITPLDREDIFALSRAVDDIIDYANSTVEEMRILKVKPDTYLQRMASLLKEAGEEILLGIQQIQDHPRIADEHAKRAKALENRVETVYREAIADLFKGPESIEQIMKMLKMREVYRHLSNAADRGDEAANILSDIVVKIL